MHELPDEEPEIKLPTSVGSWKKQESSRKPSISALLTMPNPLTKNSGKCLEVYPTDIYIYVLNYERERKEYQTT